nr:doublecortin domain-containing protein 2C isoform X2 [Dasypus novemcinctus]
MGTHGSYGLLDTTPARTILVYRNGDQFYLGKKFVVNRRRIPSFEVLLDQLNQEMDLPSGVRRLYTPTHGHQVQQLDALQQAGKYVAAGRERFKKLDYFHIVPRKPAKMRKYKEVKPVLHCEINVPSRWHTFHRTSRYINVFTNGRLFIPPVKVVIPKFSLSEWSNVLAMIGEKVFPLGGVRKLFTMNGHLLDNSKDLQDNNFYVAAGLETFKYFPYWKSSRVPSEVQEKYADMENHSRRKKKETVKGKEPYKNEVVPPKTQDSVYYAKQGKKIPTVEPLIPSGAEGDVFKARTPHTETQGAPEVKEDHDVKVEAPVDQIPAEVVKEDEELHANPDFEDEKEDNSGISFKENFPLRNRTEKKVDKNLSKNKELVPFTEKGPSDVLEATNTPVQQETPVKGESSLGKQPQEPSSPRQQERTPETQESSEQSTLEKPTQENIPETQESPEQLTLEKSTQENIPETQESPEQSPLEEPSQEKITETQEVPEQSSLEEPALQKISKGQQTQMTWDWKPIN